jgi:hypothetical protein
MLEDGIAIYAFARKHEALLEDNPDFSYNIRRFSDEAHIHLDGYIKK